MSPLEQRHVSRREWNQFFSIANGFFSTQILAAACKLDLFTVLERRPGLTREEVAAELKLAPYGARILLMGCATVGLVEVDPVTRRYFNTELSSRFLVQGSPHNAVDYIYYVKDMQQRFMMELEPSLREGTNRCLDGVPGSGDTLYKKIAGNPELESLFHRGMAAYSRIAKHLVPIPHFAQCQHVLDVGGGDGTNAITLCREYPQIKVTLFDLPEISKRAQEHAQSAGFAERIRFVAGDMLRDEWPRGVDTVLLSHIVEIFDEPTISKLYAKARGCLAADGRLIIRTMSTNDLETGGLQAAKSSLYFLALASGEGMCHPASDHVKWLRAAGFRDVEVIQAETDQVALIARAA